MELDAVLDNLNNVPEPLRPAYQQVEDDRHPAGKGKYVLKVKPAGGFSFEHTEGLRNALGAERSNASRLAAELKKFEGIKDPQAALDALANIEKLKDAVPKGQLDELVARQVNGLKSEYEGKLKMTAAEVEELNATIRELAITQAATSAILAAGGDEETVDLLLPKVLAVAHVEKVQGKKVPVVRLRGEDGVAMVTRRPNQTGPMDLNELVSDVLKPKYKGVWPSGVKKGSGVNGSDGITNGPTPDAQKVRIPRAEIGSRLNEIKALEKKARESGKSVADLVEFV